MINTSGKIVAAGGGENGRISSRGAKLPCGPGEIGREIIRLSGKEKPRVLFAPHADKEGRTDRVRSSLRHIERVGISLSNCSAIEIVDGGYRIIRSRPAGRSSEPFALRTYRKDGTMYGKMLGASDGPQDLSLLLSF